MSIHGEPIPSRYLFLCSSHALKVQCRYVTMACLIGSLYYVDVSSCTHVSPFPLLCGWRGALRCCIAACSRIGLTRCLIFHRYPFITVSSSFPVLLVFRGSWKSFNRLRVCWAGGSVCNSAQSPPFKVLSASSSTSSLEVRSMRIHEDFEVQRFLGHAGFPLSQLLSSTSIGYNLRLQVPTVCFAMSRSLIRAAIVCFLVLFFIHSSLGGFLVSVVAVFNVLFVFLARGCVLLHPWSDSRRVFNQRF